MTQHKLSNATGDHVYEDLLIGYYFGRGLKESGFHIYINNKSPRRLVMPEGLKTDGGPGES